MPAGKGWYGCVSLNTHSVVWAGWRWRWLANYFLKIGQFCLLAFYGADVPMITSPTALWCWSGDCWPNKRFDEAIHLYLFHFYFSLHSTLTAQKNLSYRKKSLFQFFRHIADQVTLMDYLYITQKFAFVIFASNPATSLWKESRNIFIHSQGTWAPLIIGHWSHLQLILMTGYIPEASVSYLVSLQTDLSMILWQSTAEPGDIHVMGA